MCGIVGIFAQHPVNQSLFDALTIIQHRGQDAAGIITSDFDKVYLRKSKGLVRDAIRQPHMERLRGNMGLGHVRYPTAGSDSNQESQPFYVNSPYGLALIHNGNLTNTRQLSRELMQTDFRHLNTYSDSEVLLNVLAHELQVDAQVVLSPEQLFQAMRRLYQRIRGAFAAIAMIHGYGIVAFRDPHGIRPLVIGVREHESGKEYMFASESVALDALGFKLFDDVKPGEAVFINQNREMFRELCTSEMEHTPCIFEYIYLARPDSVIDGISVHQARLNMGVKLGQRIAEQLDGREIDVVIPIPDTSRTSALSLAETIGVPFCEGFVKNRYIGRTFIMPGQAIRQNSVRLKLNAIRREFANKNVLLVDDSIVRGTTSREIVQMARDVGAKQVYFASAAPEIRFPNVYGIDMACSDELIAHNHTVDEVAHKIGADWLVYQHLDDVYAAIKEAAQQPLTHFEDSIFTGRYITGDVDQAYLNYIALLRNDKAKLHKGSAMLIEEEVNISD